MPDTKMTGAGSSSLTVPRASALIAFSACCFGSIPIFVLLAAQAGATLLPVLAGRYLVGALLLALFAGRSLISGVPRGRGWPLIVLFGGLQAAVAFVSLSALRWIPAATLSFLFYTYPAWIALVAAVRRTEPLTRTRLIALGLSLLGIVLMVGSPWAEPAPWQGVALALGSALLYALYVITIGRFQRGIPPAAASAWISVGAGALFLAAALASGTFTLDFAPAGWLSIGGLALFSTALGFVGFLRGLAVLGTVRTAIISTVEPFWTAVMGALVLSQALTMTTLAGGALIGTAVVVLQLGARNER